MSTNEQSQPSELGLADAAAAIAALDAPPAQPEPERKAKAPAEVEETEASAESVDETASEEDEAPQDDGSSSEEETEEVEATDDDQDDDQEETLVTVKINGKEQQISLKEAIAGYQRNADYSQKTQALAQERKALEAERNNVLVERTQYSQLLNALGQQLQQFVAQEPNWEELHRNDPLNYPIIRDQWRDYKDRLAATQVEQARLQQISEIENQGRLRDIVVQGQNYLREKVPEWRDEKTWESAKVKLREYGKKVGYTEEELRQAYDPRALIVLDKARKYDELVANRPKPVKGNTPKPMKSGGKSNVPTRSTDFARASQRLKSSGHVNDAAALFGLLDSKKR
jgi:hypothetical protein